MGTKRGPKPKRPRPAGPDLPDGWEPPAHLSEAAAVAWRHLASRLSAAGKLDAADPVIVEAYAVNVALLRAAQLAVDTDGVTLLNGAGVPTVHPACALINAATMRIKTITDSLGPTATHEPKSESKWGGLFGSAG